MAGPGGARRSWAGQGRARQSEAMIYFYGLFKTENIMNKELRESVQKVSQTALNIIMEYFDGKRPGDAQVKEAMKMVGFGLKVEHMDQISAQSDRSLALRLIKFLPSEVDKDEYIRVTNPQIAPLLLKKPENKKK